MLELYYQQGNSRRKLFRSRGKEFVIGSARGNDLILDSRQVAKRHVQFRLQADGVFLEDLGSASGTWVNKERVRLYGPLNELDEIVVGDVPVWLQGVPSAPPSVASARVLGFGPAPSSDDHALVASASTDTSDSGRGGQSGGSGGAWGSPSLQSTSGMAVADGIAADRCETASADQPPTEVGTGSAESESVMDERLAYWGGIVHEMLLEQMDLQRRDVSRMSDEQLREESRQLIQATLARLSKQLPDDLDLVLLERNVLNEAVGLGPLEQFLADDEITEIMVNNHREIFIEKAGRLVRSPFHFSSDRTVYSVIERIITPIGRRIDESSPIVDARLKDGSRVNAVIPPLALKGPSLTIRKFPRHCLGFDDLVRVGSVDERMVEFLRICVEMRKNIIVSGGTGSGKTTLLNVLSNFIPESDRVVTIEDAAELRLVQPNLVSLESRPPNLEGKGEIPIRQLVKTALRMRPDRIVVGECRGGEAIDMLQAMNTGHDGSLTTIHANNPRDVVSRLEVLVLMGGLDLPVSAIREQVASAVDLIIQQTRFPCGTRKITRITEVAGIESGTVQLQDIFRFEQHGFDHNQRVAGVFRSTGAIPTFYESLKHMGVELDLSGFDTAVQAQG